MNMSGEEKAMAPTTNISDERLKRVVEILKDAQHEKPLARERLEMLAWELDRLLGEVEMFGRVVYCREAVACLLGGGVLRVLAGSVIYENGQQKKIIKDKFYHAPTHAAHAAINRHSGVNGRKEWKDRRCRTINEIWQLQRKEENPRATTEANG